MKIWWVVLALALAPSVVRCQFEGTVTMTMTGTDEEGKSSTTSYTMFVKKDMVAADVTGGDQRQMGKFIVRSDKKVLWIVNDLEKNYVEMSFDVGAPGKKLMEKKVGASKLLKTGKKTTMLGYPCEEFVSEDKEERSQIWATAKLGNIYESLMKSFERMNLGPETGEEGWESELARLKLFPLKIVTTVGGTVRESQEVTRIDRKPVEASVFEEPKGYAKQSMENELKKMMEEYQQQMKKDSQ